MALSTLKSLQDYDLWRIKNNLSSLNIKVNFLFQQINWSELGDVYVFAQEQNVDVFRTFLYEPEQHSMLSFAEDKRIEVLEWYFSNLNIDQLLNSARVIRPLLDSLSPINKVYFYEKYLTLIKIKKQV